MCRSFRTSFSPSSCYQDLLSFFVLISVLLCPPSHSLSLSLSLWKRSEVAVTRAIRDFMFLLTVKRRQGYTHTHMTHTHTHTLSSSVLYTDRHWAKVHSATVLTISLSLPLSLFLLHTVSLSCSAFSRKVLTSNLSLLPLLSLSLGPLLRGLSSFSFVSIFSVLLSSVVWREVTSLSFTRRLAFVALAHLMPLPARLHDNYPPLIHQLCRPPPPPLSFVYLFLLITSSFLSVSAC